MPQIDPVTPSRAEFVPAPAHNPTYPGLLRERRRCKVASMARAASGATAPHSERCAEIGLTMIYRVTLAAER